MLERMKTLAALVVLAGTAWAGGHLPGSLVVTREAVDTTQKDFEKDLKQKSVKTVSKDGDKWSFHFVAFLKKSPGSKAVNLVFYDPTHKNEPVNHVELTTTPGAKIMQSEVVLGEDLGLKAGKTYDVRLTRLIGGREEIYARTQLTLK
jgi:hypothetical protein